MFFDFFKMLLKKGVCKPPPPTDKLGFPPGFPNKIHLRMCDHGAASIPEDGPVPSVKSIGPPP